MSKPLHESCPKLLALSREYGNCQDDYAQDCILVKLTNCSPNFSWRRFDKKHAYKTYNDLTGCHSQVREIGLTPSELIHGMTKTRALEAAICKTDKDIQDCVRDPQQVFNLEQQALEEIMDSLKLNKERRIWEEVLQVSNYSTGNLTDLTGVEIDAAANATDILKLIRNIRAETCSAARQNYAVMSHKTAEKMIQSEAFRAQGCCEVLTSVDKIANLLGLAGICIADAKVDIGGMGIDSDIVDIFDDSILLYRKNENMRSSTCPKGTFAAEVLYAPNGQEMSVYRNNDNWNMGLHGGCRIKAGYSSDIIYQYELAHLITNVCA